MDAYSKFVQRMTERANTHQDAMRGMNPKAAFKYVSRVIADNDVVVGVFPDQDEPHGVGVHPIKGMQHINATSNIPERLRCDAVPCVERAQAIAAEQRFAAKPN